MDINKLFNKNFGKIAGENVTVEEPTMQEPLQFKNPVQKPPAKPSVKQPVENIPSDESVVTEVPEEGLLIKINRADSLMMEMMSYIKAGFAGRELEQAGQDLSSLLSDIKSEMRLRKIN